MTKIIYTIGKSICQASTSSKLYSQVSQPVYYSKNWERYLSRTNSEFESISPS